MVCLALTRTKWAVLVFSWTAGVMYSTLFTMPYLLVRQILLCENKNIFLVARWLTIMRQTPSTVKTPGSSNRFAACSPPSRPTKPPVRREPRGWRTTLETSSVARYEAASHWSMLSIL